jgi:penicillin-binding protein 1A
LRLRRHKDPPTRNGNGRGRIRKLRLFALLLVLALLGSASFGFGFMTAVAKEIPRLDPSRQVAREENSYIVDFEGDRNLAVLRGGENRVIVASDEIAPVMKQAIVAVEDKRFFDHRGVDARAILRAFWADIRNQSVVQGGSTITQQFVKNVYVKNQQSIGRKVREAALAWQLEQQWSKDKILTEYLNTIYYGNGAYGVEQAARVYFGRSAKGLSLPEAALLAGIPADPTRFDPKTNPSAAKERRELVLSMMREQGLIGEGEYVAALNAPMPRPQEIRLPGSLAGDEAPYFVNYVKQQLVDKYGAQEVFGGGLRVKTTIDLELQELARKAIAKWLTDVGPEAALVAIRPDSGRVVAMVGGSNFRESQFNLAVQGERQAGSSFKPFVLAAALREGLSTSNTFVSKPVEIWADGRMWEVENYEGSYLGSIDLRNATIHSDNAVFAQLTQLVGPRSVVNAARDLGITTRLNAYYAIGLGAEAVNPLEMARAFSTFANNGLRVDGSLFGNSPRAIASVERNGHVEDNKVSARRVLDPDKAAILNDVLQGVVRQGTGRAAALPDRRPVAGKTGTTENFGDAWFVGYTPQLAVAVWVGYPSELRPMLTDFHGDSVAGGTYPALIWKSFMEKALPAKGWKPAPFPPPEYAPAEARSVVLRDGILQADNGYCRGARPALVFYGEAPRKTADCKPNEVEVPKVVGVPIDEARKQVAATPLSPLAIYKPAAAGQALNVVVRQDPKAGRRVSAGERVILVLAKPEHGVIPKVVGLPVDSAKDKLEELELETEVRGEGRVVAQSPKWGTALVPGAAITLVARAG